MKTFQRILQIMYGLFSNNVGVSDVTEFKKGTETVHNV